MDLQGTVIRPPSEAGSILLQVSLGCTHGTCAFCGAYLEKPFAIKDRETVRADIRFASARCVGMRKVFLCDGDALSLPQEFLEDVLAEIRRELPWVTRVAAYGNARGLRRKSDRDLRRLRRLGLGKVYMGLESGDEATLEAMNKQCTAACMVEQGKRVMEAGLRFNVTVINGLAGPERSLVHARETALALNRMQPHQVAALSLMLVPGTPLYKRWKQGDFTVLDGRGMLAELRELLAGLEMKRGLFLANHASNYLPVRARMPRDKAATLRALDAALDGELALRPEGMRGL